jgi:hypothetical protein
MVVERSTVPPVFVISLTPAIARAAGEIIELLATAPRLSLLPIEDQAKGTHPMAAVLREA